MLHFIRLIKIHNKIFEGANKCNKFGTDKKFLKSISKFIKNGDTKFSHVDSFGLYFR